MIHKYRYYLGRPGKAVKWFGTIHAHNASDNQESQTCEGKGGTWGLDEVYFNNTRQILTDAAVIAIIIQKMLQCET
jgi:hypothetical protein